MSKQIKLALAFSVALGLPALAQETDTPGVTADTVVATVNGADITIGHMIAAGNTLPAQYRSLPDDVLYQGILDQIIQQTVLSQIGEENLTKRDRLVIENERRAYLAGTILDEASRSAVTEEALQTAYDARFANAEPSKEFNAAHILLETEDDAKAIKAELDDGADFATLAKEKSTGPSGPNGGELGWFGLGMMVQPFEEAVVSMEAGDISGPIQTQFGWHILRLNETRLSAAPTLDDVREELAADIQNAAIEARVTGATESADITRSADEIDPSVIKDISLIDPDAAPVNDLTNME